MVNNYQVGHVRQESHSRVIQGHILVHLDRESVHEECAREGYGKYVYQNSHDFAGLPPRKRLRLDPDLVTNFMGAAQRGMLRLDCLRADGFELRPVNHAGYIACGKIDSRLGEGKDDVGEDDWVLI
jgi:hypothetical protein